MTTEQKEAIKKLKQKLKPSEYGGYCVLGYNEKYCFGKSEVEAIETILNLIQEQEEKIDYYKKQKDYDMQFRHELLEQIRCLNLNIDEKNANIDKRDKMIDLIINTVYKRFKAELLLEYGFENDEQFKQYFERKMENDNS